MHVCRDCQLQHLLDRSQPIKQINGIGKSFIEPNFTRRHTIIACEKPESIPCLQNICTPTRVEPIGLRQAPEVVVPPWRTENQTKMGFVQPYWSEIQATIRYCLFWWPQDQDWIYAPSWSNHATWVDRCRVFFPDHRAAPPPWDLLIWLGPWWHCYRWSKALLAYKFITHL